MTLEQEQEYRRKKLTLVKALERAREALGQEDFSAAAIQFRAAIDIAAAMGENQTEAEAGLLDTLYKAGKQAERQNRLQDACAHYNGVLERDSEHHDAQVRLNAVNRKLMMQRATIGVITFMILAVLLALFSRSIPWPAAVCNTDGVGAVLCKPTPIPTPPIPTPTPTPYLIIEILNSENTPVPVRELGVLEDALPLSACVEDCRRVERSFSSAAADVGAYIHLYTEAHQMLIDEDSLPAVMESSNAEPDAEFHSVQWPRWNTGEHTARFVVVTMTPTPTFTPTPMPTPTYTPTPTPTPTPVPRIAKGASPNPNVFDKPGGTLLFYLQRGVCVYVCQEIDDYYQVANDYCHRTTPIGWVRKTHLTEAISSLEGCPLVTPVPLPTSTSAP